MFDLFINNFEKIVGGLLVAVFGGYVGYRTYRKTLFNQAAATYRSKVLTELEGLYPISTNWPTDINALDAKLKAAFPKLQIAINEFRVSLPWYHRKSFDRAWFVYRLGEDGREIDIQCYHHYMPFGSNPEYKQNFKHNVDSLLKYAKFP